MSAGASYFVHRVGADPMGDYAANLNLILKVLDFVQSGGPSGTVLQTFEWVVPL